MTVDTASGRSAPAAQARSSDIKWKSGKLEKWKSKLKVQPAACDVDPVPDAAAQTGAARGTDVLSTDFSTSSTFPLLLTCVRRVPGGCPCGIADRSRHSQRLRVGCLRRGSSGHSHRRPGYRHRPGVLGRDGCHRAVHARRSHAGHLPGHRDPSGFFRGCADGGDQRGARHARGAGATRARCAERRRERDGGSRPAREPSDSAPRRDDHEGRHRAGQPAVDWRRADCRGQHHTGRQWTVRRAPAAAGARLHAAARARGRRAPQHGPPGDRPSGCGSRAHLAGRHQPDGDRQRRRDAPLRFGRAGRHDQHHHQ